MRSAFGVLAVIAIACATTATRLDAQIPTDRAYLEFPSPIRIPGATLAPGMYLFVIGPPVGGQSMVDVYASDGSRLIASVLAIRSSIDRPPMATTIDYPGGPPAALRAWFHPSNRSGLEFVYDAADARALHAQTGIAVPYLRFNARTRDLVGAIPIGRAGIASSGGGAVIETVSDTMGPHDHLTAARRLIAYEGRTFQQQAMALEILASQVSRLQGDFRRNKWKDVNAGLELVDTTITRMLPSDAAVMARRGQAPSRDLVELLERVHAHVRAFANAAAPAMRAGR